METFTYIADAVVWLMGVIVLFRLFKVGGFLKGLLGLIFMPFTYIWGWIHAKDQNLKTIMWVWTLLVVITAVLNVVAQSAG
jgi:hypothetical protein